MGEKHAFLERNPVELNGEPLFLEVYRSIQVFIEGAGVPCTSSDLERSSTYNLDSMPSPIDNGIRFVESGEANIVTMFRCVPPSRIGPRRPIHQIGGKTVESLNSGLASNQSHKGCGLGWVSVGVARGRGISGGNIKSDGERETRSFVRCLLGANNRNNRWDK